MSVLDRWGKPVEQPKERKAIGFLERTLPHKEDLEVLTGLQRDSQLPLTPDHDPVQLTRKDTPCRASR